MAENELTQWEYKYVEPDPTTLNKEGQNGWEATGTSNTNGILVKRPKIKQKEPSYGYER